MAKQLFIPGIGPVYFPDEMSEEEMAAAAKQAYEQTPQSERMSNISQQASDINVDSVLADAQQFGNEMMSGMDYPTMGRQVGRRAGENALAVPRAAGTALAGAAAGLETAADSIPRAIAGEPQEVGARLKQNFLKEKNRGVAGMLRQSPDLTDLEAAGTVAARLPFMDGQDIDFDAVRSQIVEREASIYDQYGKESLWGEALGDAATLVGIRAPRAKSRQRKFARDNNERLLQASENAAQEFLRTPTVGEASRRTLDRIVNSGIAQSLKQGGSKVVEAGVDGAVMAALTDDDPLTAIALNSGSQAIGSVALAANKGILAKGGLGIAVTAAGLIGWMQLAKEATPGGRDRILESTESAFAKIAAAMALGGIAGAAGMGRVRGEFAFDWPVIADAVTAIPRGTVMSFLREMNEKDQEDGSDRYYAVINKMSEDPEYFGAAAKRRFNRALKSNGEISIFETMDNLAETDRKFRQKWKTVAGEL